MSEPYYTDASTAPTNTSKRSPRMTEMLTAITPEIERDRFGRPLIVPPGGGKKQAYTRATTYVGCLEDTWNLSKWSQRKVAIGLADRPDLLLAVAAHRNDKNMLNKLCADAAEAAKAHAAATTGTALHALTEIIDRGAALPILPEAARADVAAYAATTAGVDWSAIEQLIVVDHLKVAGTPDRVGARAGWARPRIWDVKTGSLAFGMGKIAMQLAMYVHGVYYDHTTGRREPMPEVDLEVGVVIHLPAGTGTCTLLEVDLLAGWEAVQLAGAVRAWRARKDLARPLDLPPDLFALIGVCADAAAVRAVWAANQGGWTEAHTEAARARIAVLAATAA